ncbi:uncharacterized protein LOC584759 isoform X5 [Strongylocentrotus purpuratus]|uniref:ATP-dependent DNA helicase n=1 Tax=Strongylocentrotus purpuratus TaxID=7668 RepID=A0A7M7NAW6_STRPU|nr:uncharacterized protein LOC584759 isoform X5 [Strongylocentrotus purpuratus]
MLLLYRYQPLETVDEVFNDDVLLLPKQNDKQKKCRSKKRYFKKCKKIIIEPGNQSVKVMKSSEFDTHEHDHLVTQRDSPKQRDQVHSEEVGSNEWMKVKSKKAKMLEKMQDRISHSTAKSDSGTGQKKRIINGVVLEPGVTYIGKAMKSFYERRKSKKSKRKVDIKLNRDVECQNVLENNVQMYAEKLLNEYSKCVQSPKSMMSHETKLYKENNMKQKQSWADVVGHVQNEIIQEHSIVGSATCSHVFLKQYKGKEQSTFRVCGGAKPNDKGKVCDGKTENAGEVKVDKDCKQHVDKSIPMKMFEMKHDSKFHKQSVNTSNVNLEEKQIPNENMSNMEQNTLVQCVALGNFHQGNARFGFYSGKQCVSNSFAAILYSKITDVSQWQKQDLDKVLNYGNELYRFIQLSSAINEDFLLISELPDQLEAFDVHFKMQCSQSVVGIICGDESFLSHFNAVTLKDALHQELDRHDACFCTFGGQTFAIISTQEQYFIFDSHSRDRHGLMTDGGTSVILCSSNWEGVYDHILKLAESMGINRNQTEFELTGIIVNLINSSEITVTEHGDNGHVAKDEQDCINVVEGNDGFFLPTDRTDKSSRCVPTNVPDSIEINEDDCNIIDTENDRNDCRYFASSFSTDMSDCIEIDDDEDDCIIIDAEHDTNYCKDLFSGAPSDRPDSINIDDVDDDDCMVIDTEYITNNYKYFPVHSSEKKKMCARFNITDTCISSKSDIDTCINIGTPAIISNITGDGNCFYRAISLFLTGKEGNHKFLRQKCIQHLLENSHLFAGCLRYEFVSVKDYVSKNKPDINGEWATEVEIAVMAHLLETDILIFSDIYLKWRLYSWNNPGRIVHDSNMGIYLLHVKGVHFDYVESVNCIDLVTDEGKKTKEVTCNKKRSINSEMLKDKSKLSKQYASCATKDEIEETFMPSLSGKSEDIFMSKRKRKGDTIHESVKCAKSKKMSFPKMHRYCKTKEPKLENGERDKKSASKITSYPSDNCNTMNRGVSDVLNKGNVFIVNDPLKIRNEKIVLKKVSIRLVRLSESEIKNLSFDLLKGIKKTQSSANFKGTNIPGKGSTIEFPKKQIKKENKKSKCKQSLKKRQQLAKERMKAKRKQINDQDAYENVQNNENYANDMDGCKFKGDFSDVKKTKMKQKYHSNKSFRDEKKKKIKEKYQSDESFRDEHKQKIKQKYESNILFRDEHKKKIKLKYESNESFRDEHKKKMKQKIKHDYESNKSFRDEHKQKIKHKYESNILFRDEHKKKIKLKYESNESFRDEHKKKIKHKYESNMLFRDEHKKKIKLKYESNESFRDEHKKKIKHKYESNMLFRDEHKKKIKLKYESNESFRDEHKKKMKQKIKHNYQSNKSFRDEHKKKMKQKIKHNYQSNMLFRDEHKKKKRKKYHSNQHYRQRLAEKNKERAGLKKMSFKKLENVLGNFRNVISHGPEYVCCVCLKLLFQSQVLKCIKPNYQNKTCMNESYLHICNSHCNENCQLAHSSRGHLWICFTCHRKLLVNKLPAEASVNSLQLHEIPEELKDLNNLEQHLIARNISFFKLIRLPKGGQNAVHGPVVCVPSNTMKTVNMLPPPEREDQLIRVKLKRKISYKGHHEYKFVNKNKVLNGLHYLKKNNKWYSDISINENWNNSLSGEMCSAETNDNDDSIQNFEEQENDDQEARLNGIQLDTCLQPVDIGQEILDQHFDDIFCCAPCEGNNPIALLRDESNEPKSFPVLFPKGQPTYHDFRSVRVTLGRYLQNRLMHVDNRFAKSTDFIFYAQCIYEIQQVLSGVSIALRKTSSKSDTDAPITIKDLKQIDKVQDILKSDRGFRFLKQIRGSPPYWSATQKDLLAMVRQLGIPTWFASFSAADMRWPEVLNTLLMERGDKRKINDLDWTDKCELLKSNPVTVARMFDKRFHTFLKNVILSEAHPIGHVIDYFYRVEFQQRGSPHTHCLFWVKDAPEHGYSSDEEVVSFIDKYISCKIPSEQEDPELHEIITHVQQHSKKHSKSCKKKGKTCRFNFPRPPSDRTCVLYPKEGNPDEIDSAKQLLESIKNAVNQENNYTNVSDLFRDCNTTQTEFETATRLLAKQEILIKKRDPKDVWINQYNPFLLRAWNANMDLQFVMDVYACVRYIVSYISKSEREMGMLLSHAQSEINEGNHDARKSIRQLGNVYMQNREVSAQESVYRVCSLRLKECSRKVEFIPVGPNPVRMSLPLHVIQRRPDDDDDDRSPWMANKLDRYKARPNGSEFDTMCLAKFCACYRILTASQVKGTKTSPYLFELKNNSGYIQKRTRSSVAVVRYPRFSKILSPEKYYLSILQLFLPFSNDEQLKPPQFETYQEFYKTGNVKLQGGNLESVKSIVDKHCKEYERNSRAIEQAELFMDKFGSPEDAWALLCPESEKERLENPKNKVEMDEPECELDIPDFKHEKKNETSSVEFRSHGISKHESNSLIRCLNNEQKEIFYKIRQWCLEKVNGTESQPFHVLISGGAGTGKSYLIKCIYHEAVRILGKMMVNPDDISILKVAPTGIAAFNIEGSTIHSALSVPITAKFPYRPLGEERINTLRNKLGQLQILIIDEISMVDSKLLYYIHGRLRQIKQSRTDCPFGNVSVLAVGDFYQLPPVKGTPLYKESVEQLLWSENFKKVELVEIMRQKEDLAFALLLNRLRVKEKKDNLSDADLSILTSCETGEECEEDMHIYSTNKQVNEWNSRMLHSKCEDIICVKAEDRNNSKDNDEICTEPCKSSQSSLPRNLSIALNARVMLLKNIDTNIGLTNGCIGTVAEIVKRNNESKPYCISVKFDSQKIGIQSIKMYEESMGKNYTRKQFPLKLAYACTVHKVQGMTLNKVVVSLKKIFASGHSYVGLSRVTSLSGLTIEDFHPKVIYCDPKIKKHLNDMTNFLETSIAEETYDDGLCIMLHNIQGLKQHYVDLQCNPTFLNSDIICLTETWLSDKDDAFEIFLAHFKLYHQSRYNSYSITSDSRQQFKDQSHGGVAVYSKNEFSSRLDIKIDNLEFIAFLVTCPVSVVIAVVYRPPTYRIKDFCECLNNLLEELHKVGTKCIVMGDFNDNLLKQSSKIQDLMCNHGYTQHVKQSTTEGDTLIDHVYSKGLPLVETQVIPIYYSYHEAIKIKLFHI